MRNGPTENGGESSGTPQDTQPLNESLQDASPAFFDAWRHPPGKQLEQPQQVSRKENERVETGQQNENQSSRSGCKRGEWPTGERLIPGQRGIQEGYGRQQEKHDGVKQSINGE